MEPGPSDLTGAVLDGRYRVIEPIASGAMGVVYRAERVKLGRIVAIKVLHDELPNELSSRKRFELEAMAMAKLEHPHCAAVLDVGIHEEKPFVVMDFVSGQNLKEVLANGALPIARAVEIVRQVLSGLAHAHEHGIIHRDIKPANIVLSQKAGLGDHVKILDFGLARLSAESSKLTTGIVVGTPSYMAPEQIRGIAIDKRADIYACGILMFELLTGYKPFVSVKDDPIEVCSLHLKAKPPRLADLAPGHEFGELEAIVARALAKTPDERFASAEEMANALAATTGRQAFLTPAAGIPRGVPGVPSAPIASGGSASVPVAAPAQSTLFPGAGVVTVPVPPTPATAGSASAPAATAGSASAPVSTPPTAGFPSVPAVTAGSASAPAMPSADPTASAFTGNPAPAPPASPARGKASPFAPTEPAGRTIDEPRALPFTRRQLAIVGGSLLGLIILIAVIAGGSSSKSAATVRDGGVAHPEQPEINFEAGDPVGDVLARASELAEKGRREAAIDTLISARKTYPKDARLAYEAGKLYFAKLWWDDGLAQLKAAVRLDPQLKEDPELIKMVLKGFITTPGYDAPLASFLRNEIGEPARPYLEETAKHHPNAAKRSRAASELRRY